MAHLNPAGKSVSSCPPLAVYWAHTLPSPGHGLVLANKCSYIPRGLEASSMRHPSTSLSVVLAVQGRDVSPGSISLCIGQTKNSRVQLLLDSSRGDILVSSLLHTSISPLLRRLPPVRHLNCYFKLNL